MLTIKKIVYTATGMALCSMILLGCSEDQGKKQENKIETTQERIGKEAAQNLHKPLEDARKAAQLGTERVETLNEAARDSKPQAGGKERKKLEGC